MLSRVLPAKPTFAIQGRVALTIAIVLLVVWLSPHARAASTLGILAAMLCSIFLFPSIAKVPSHVWGPLAGVGALLLIARLPLARLGVEVPHLSWGIVWHEVSGHLDMPILILSHAYLSFSLDDAGFFNWCSFKLMRAGRGSGLRLMVALFLGVFLVTFFTSNDIVILSLTPILICLGNNARIRNLVPFLMAEFVAANTASMAMYIGNPTNIVIGNAVGLGFVQYFQRMCLPTLVATGVALGLVLLLFGRFSRSNRIPDRYELLATSDETRWTREMTVRVVLFGSCLVFLAIFGNPIVLGKLLHIGDQVAVSRAVSRLIVGITALTAVVVFSVDVIQARRTSGKRWHQRVGARLGRMPIEIVPFFLSFCVVLRWLEETGLTRYASDAVVRAFQHGPWIGSLATGGYAVLAVNVTNNIPAAILFEKTWLGNLTATPPIVGLADRLSELDPSYAKIFVDVCLFATNFGANLTFIGALAGLMWLRLIRDQARRAPEVERVPTARELLVYGAILVPAVTAVTCIWIAMSNVVGR
jgi:arsenical pump membrane protein